MHFALRSALFQDIAHFRIVPLTRMLNFKAPQSFKTLMIGPHQMKTVEGVAF